MAEYFSPTTIDSNNWLSWSEVPERTGHRLTACRIATENLSWSDLARLCDPGQNGRARWWQELATDMAVYERCDGNFVFWLLGRGAINNDDDDDVCGLYVSVQSWMSWCQNVIS